MGSDVTLSKGVRANLLSLQNTAEMMARTQERLSTGKKVNSALDNPVNYFTAAGLHARASDLGTLLDSIGNGVQTLAAADKGISAISKLVESLKSTAKQALLAGQPASTYALNVAGTAIPADTAAVGTGSATIPADQPAVLTGTVGGLAGTDTLTSLGISNGQTITITDGTNTVTHTVVNAATEDLDDLMTTLNGGGATWTVALNGGFLEVTSNNNADTLTISGSGSASAFGTTTTGGPTNATVAALTGILSVQQGSNPAVNVDFSTVTTRAGILTALGGIGSFVGNNLVLTATNTTDSIAVSGTGTSVSGLGLSAAYDPANAAIGALSGTLTIQHGTGSTQTLTFGGSGISNRAELTTALAGLGITGLTASITGNAVTFTSTTAGALTLGGTVLPALGLTPGATNPTATVGTPNATRTSLTSDFNELLLQITNLANDASYNGINLLSSDNLTVIFNEDGSSSLVIDGIDFTASGLGLTPLTGNGLQVDADVNAAIAQIDAATAQLRAQASAFGSNLSIVQARQDFTKNLINVLELGGDALILADTNEEGANLLALQTRQSLSTTSLSMAAQADQNVLRLFQ
jgi:flagellin